MKESINISSMKYGNIVNYEWKSTILEKNDNYILTFGKSGRKLIHHGKGKIFTFDNPCIEFFSLTDGYTVSVEKNAEGKLFYYCNICMPSEVFKKELKFIDLDFDFIKSFEGDWTLVDEDEFKVNSIKYNYPKELVNRAILEKNKMDDRIKSGLYPFDGWILQKVDKYLKTT